MRIRSSWPALAIISRVAVDGCQPNVLTLVAEVVVDLAGGAEVVGAGEQVGDSGALPRPPLRGGYHLSSCAAGSHRHNNTTKIFNNNG